MTNVQNPEMTALKERASVILDQLQGLLNNPDEGEGEKPLVDEMMAKYGVELAGMRVQVDKLNQQLLSVQQQLNILADQIDVVRKMPEDLARSADYLMGDG